VQELLDALGVQQGVLQSGEIFLHIVSHTNPLPEASG